MSWTAAVDFSSGRLHRRDSRPCQDYGQVLKLDENLILGAIADGAGTCPMSHLGAHAAVGSVIRHGVERYQVSRSKKDPHAAGIDLALAALIEESTEVARDSVARVAQENRLPLDALATTLLVFAAGPLGFAAVQVGDSALVYRDASTGYRLALSPDRGEYANETLFITDAAARAETRLEHHQGSIAFIAAFSDGLMPVSIANDDQRPHAPFFQPLDEFVSGSESDGDVHRGIRAFLRSERLVERTDDDMTLMLCGWQPDDGLARAAQA